VPLPAVMEPPLIVQLYVAPEVVGTEAVLPVELAQTDDGAVIVDGGVAFTVTVTDAQAEL
jgi:hypothetical protein